MVKCFHLRDYCPQILSSSLSSLLAPVESHRPQPQLSVDLEPHPEQFRTQPELPALPVVSGSYFCSNCGIPVVEG